MFVFLARQILRGDTNDAYPFMYPIILACILGFIVVKIILQMSNGFIFGSGKTISELIFKKLSYLNYSGIIMFLANVMLAYVAQGSEIVVYVAILLVLLINVIGWVTVLRNHQKFITSYFFYFILYLCALEISPFVIIGSYLKQ
ncbi:DUF4271 domain-containing protein [Zobellia laminariae]|nr:DUF4271 domain-containing protein [Zobellia laminariae]WKX78310.1 DUF4271 domain-containing protein [Zobellia laminariae]